MAKTKLQLVVFIHVGVVGITSSEHNLIETHSHLMTQNVSLLTLLEKQQLPELNTETSPPL